MYDEYNRRCFLVRSADIGLGLAFGCAGFAGCRIQSGKSAAKKRHSEIIAYCGLNCVECPIYLATREADPVKQRQIREQIVVAIKKYLGEEKRIEDITDCDGCKAKSGRLYSNCRKCQIRKCASEKGLENCAYCGEYICEKLSRFFDSEDKEGVARKRLDAIRTFL